MRRHWPATLAIFAVLTLLSSILLMAPGQRGDASEGIILGATPEPIGGSRQAGVAEIEAQIGRKLGLVRDFESWDSTFPSAFQNEMIAGNRLLVVSVRPKRDNGTIIPWRDIADAAPGSKLYGEMISWAHRLRDLGVPVWFALHHEPEAAGSAGYGEAEDFVAAWQKFVDIIRNEGADNVEFVWIMTSWAFEVSDLDPRHADNWYPGDTYVDLIGSDAYNWGKCRESVTDTWRSLEETIEPQRQFGLEHPGKDLLLAEVASTERPSDWGDAKADWIDEAQMLFQQPGWEQFIAISFFDVIDDTYPYCHWPVDSSPEALAALVDLAADPYYGNGTGGTPPGGGDGGTFADVPPDHLFATQIEWLADMEITLGCNPPVNDRFCPDALVTRGQMAAFLVRALGYGDDGGGDLFVDDDGSVFESSIDRLATAGVTYGCNPPGNDRFCPADPVTRAQMAAFLYRALD